MKILLTIIVLFLSMQGYSQHSLDFVIPPCPHVGIAGTDCSETDFVVFPNPASGTLFVEAGNANGFEKVHIRVYNVLGRLVATHDLNPYSQRASIDVSTLRSGLYLLELNTGSTILRKKVIIDNSLRNRE